MRYSGKMPAGLARLQGSAGAALLTAALLSAPAEAARMPVPRIESFGPYALGMTVDQAKAAHKGGTLGACGDIAPERRCLILDAAVFEEPGVIHAVLDGAGAKIERIVVRLDPQRTQRRAYRCVRLSEKVFALLVVVYGSEYKQSYDKDRRPLPAVAWDGALSGRLIFEPKCRTADEGNPWISVVAHRPDGVEPPKVSEKTAPKAAAPVATALPPGGPPAPALAPQPLAEAPVPASAPVGVVEQIGPDTSGAVSADAAMAALARELAHAKGKAPAAPTPAPSVDSAVAARLAPPVQAMATVDPDELPEPPDLVAPEPFMVPEEEAAFRERREASAAEVSAPARAAETAPVALLAAMPSARPAPPEPVAAGAPDELPEPSDLVAPEPFMVPEEEELFRQRREPPTAERAARVPAAETAPAAPVPARQAVATVKNIDHVPEPVMTGGWRHRAPVPPAKPWRDRADAAG